MNLQHQNLIEHQNSVNQNNADVEAVKGASQVSMLKQQGSNDRAAANAHHKNIKDFFNTHGDSIKRQGGSVNYGPNGLTVNVNPPATPAAPESKGPKFRARAPKA
jgi:hypothetical protein